MIPDLPPGPEGPAPRILYIGGWGRSGSTLLARLLGEHPTMTFVGELRDLWHRGVAENRLCGCGEPFFECRFWSAVGERAFGGWDAVPVEALQHLRDQVDKPWWVPFFRRGRVPGRVAEDAALYVDLLTRVTRAMQAEVGPDGWIIDSSKIPSFAWLLGRIPDLDLRTVHLVRDARGSVYSWQKSVRRTDDPDAQGDDAPMMLQYNPLNASARYVVYNRQAEGLAKVSSRYVRTRYEDLVTEPERELDRIVERLDLPGWDNGQLRDGSIQLGASHSVVGNPMRMDTGWMPLRPDTAWKQDMDAGSRRLVTAVTGTTLRRYDYSTT